MQSDEAMESKKGISDSVCKFACGLVVLAELVELLVKFLWHVSIRVPQCYRTAGLHRIYLWQRDIRNDDLIQSRGSIPGALLKVPVWSILVWAFGGRVFPGLGSGNLCDRALVGGVCGRASCEDLSTPFPVHFGVKSQGGAAYRSAIQPD